MFGLFKRTDIHDELVKAQKSMLALKEDEIEQLVEQQKELKSVIAKNEVDIDKLKTEYEEKIDKALRLFKEVLEQMIKVLEDE